MSLISKLFERKILKYDQSSSIFQYIYGSISKNTSVHSHINTKKHLKSNLGKRKKYKGHAIETSFRKQFSRSFDSTRFKCGSDNTIKRTHPIVNILKQKLNIKGLEVSNKSGKNIQFTLGRIPEWENNLTISTLNNPSFIEYTFKKYLKKEYTDFVCDILVYYDEQNIQWIFFNMDDIIEFIKKNAKWRILQSGRVKGDFFQKQYLTYEYRNTHHSYFLGANGNRGEPFIRLLQEHLEFIFVPIEHMVE